MDGDGPHWRDPAGIVSARDRLAAETLYSLAIAANFNAYAMPKVTVRFADAPLPGEVELAAGYARMADGTAFIFITTEVAPGQSEADWLSGIVDHTDAVELLLAEQPELASYAADGVTGIVRLGRRRDILRQQLAHEVAHAVLEEAGVLETDEHGPRWRDLFRRFCEALGAGRDEIEARAMAALKEGSLAHLVS